MLRKIILVSCWATLVVVVFFTLSPVGFRPHLFSHPWMDRFVAFAIGGFLLGLCYPRRLPLIMAVVVGGAWGIEILQLLRPGRDARILDATVKMVGGAGGVIAAWVVLVATNWISARRNRTSGV